MKISGNKKTLYGTGLKTSCPGGPSSGTGGNSFHSPWIRGRNKKDSWIDLQDSGPDETMEDGVSRETTQDPLPL